MMILPDVFSFSEGLYRMVIHQVSPEILSGKRFSYIANFFGGPCSNQLTTPVATFWSQVNNIIRNFDNIKIMFNDQD